MKIRHSVTGPAVSIMFTLLVLFILFSSFKADTTAPGSLQQNTTIEGKSVASRSAAPTAIAPAPAMHHRSARHLALIAGWTGTVAYIIAYLLLSLEKLSSNHVGYHLLNALGAAGLIVNALHLDDYPNLIVNAVWLAIAFMAISLIIRKQQARKNSTG